MFPEKEVAPKIFVLKRKMPCNHGTGSVRSKEIEDFP